MNDVIHQRVVDVNVRNTQIEYLRRWIIANTPPPHPDKNQVMAGFDATPYQTNKALIEENATLITAYTKLEGLLLQYDLGRFIPREQVFLSQEMSADTTVDCEGRVRLHQDVINALHLADSSNYLVCNLGTVAFRALQHRLQLRNAAQNQSQTRPQSPSFTPMVELHDASCSPIHFDEGGDMIVSGEGAENRDEHFGMGVEFEPDDEMLPVQNVGNVEPVNAEIVDNVINVANIPPV